MIDILKSKYNQKIIILAVLLRVLVIPFFFHPDIRIYNFQSSFLRQGVFNIYDYLVNNRQNLHYKEEFVYFPLTYLFLGSYQLIASPFLGAEFNNWLSGESAVNLFRYLFILKLPYLFFDISIAMLLYKYFDNKRDKELALTLWLFNPFSIALIYFYSNIDIIPVFFTLLSLLMLKRNNGLLAGILLAIGAGFKAYPMLLIPSLFLTNEKIQKQIKNIILSLIVFFIIILPFWGEGFIESAFSSGLTNRIFENGIDLGLIRKIPYYSFFYLMGFFYTYFKKKETPWIFYLSSVLMLVAAINYNIQWLLWFMPFLIIFLTLNRKYILYALVTLIFGISVPLLINDRFMSAALLVPIDKVFLQVSYPYLFIKNFIDPMFIKNILRILFFISSFFITYKALVNKNA